MKRNFSWPPHRSDYQMSFTNFYPQSSFNVDSKDMGCDVRSEVHMSSRVSGETYCRTLNGWAYTGFYETKKTLRTRKPSF